jgi:hypothetical protein
MSRLTRLVLGAAAVLATTVPLAPAHAITCGPVDRPACTAYAKVCAALSTHDQLHQLLCTLS